MAGNPPPVGPGNQPISPLQGAPNPAGAPSPLLFQTAQNIVIALNAILQKLGTGISLVATVSTFTFAALPNAATNPALVTFVSNARKPGEGPGAGTGMLAFSDGNSWYSTAGTLLAD